MAKPPLERFFHGSYDAHCYLPLYLFCGGHPLLALLRPADLDAGVAARRHPPRDGGFAAAVTRGGPPAVSQDRLRARPFRQPP